MPDGSIRIITKLDNSKLDKDVISLENKIKKLQSDISKNNLEQKGLEKNIQKFEQLQQEAEEYRQKIKQLNIERSNFGNQFNGMIPASQIPVRDNITSQIELMKQKYAETTSEIDKQFPKMDKIYTKLNDLKTKNIENNAKMSEYKQKIEEAQKKQLELNYTTEGVGKSINSGIKKILRYSMALISIRSIYGLLSSAMNSWLNGNNKGAQQLKSDISYMKNALGKALSPILKYIVDLLYQALGFTGALIKAFTGVDIFAGSVADYMESATSSANKTNKELKKQLTSFDKINKLNDNESSKSGVGIAAPSQDLSQIMNRYTEIAEKIKAKFEEIKDLIPIIGAGILAWKLSDLFFSQLEGLTALKAKIGLTLLITGLTMWYQGVSGFQNGEITGENTLKMLAGAIGAGVGAGMLTASVPIAIALSGILIILGAAEGGKHTLMGVIAKHLGLEPGGDTAVYSISFGLELGAKIIGEDSFVAFLAKHIKDILKRVANWVEGIPFIGKSIANGIRSFVKASESETADTIKYSTQKSLEEANPWVKGIANKCGKETRQAYQGGYSSLTDETTNTIINEENKAMDNASKTVNRHAYGSGQSEAQSINSGIASESLAQGINTLLNTGRDALNNSTMSFEGQKVGATIESGYSSNSLNSSTQKMVYDAKSVLNNSSLNPEGQHLSKTAGQGIKDNSWAVTNESKDVANKALNSFESVNGLSSGANLVAGIARGIKNNRSKVTNAISGLASGAITAFNIALGIHSPSRVMAEQAKFIPLGIAEGVDSTSNKAINSMKDLVYGMQESVDGLDYSNISQIPKLPKNAVSYTPKQAISTNEVQRNIVGEDSNILNKLLSNIQTTPNNTSITIPLVIDGEEFIRKVVQLNGEYNLVTNGGGLG